MTRIVDVSISAPDAEWLAEHTRDLIEARLVASGNITLGVRSLYRWQGAIEDETEAIVVLHTTAQHVEAIIAVTNAVHPYEIVHILATEIVEADPGYERWVTDETTPVD